MVGRVTSGHAGGMRAFAEDIALRAIDLVAAPAAILGVALVLGLVFSGLAGRAVLFLEVVPSRMLALARTSTGDARPQRETARMGGYGGRLHASRGR